ncbi:signal peptidase II [Aurantibacter crassamenti]|uniref:signal peptidase II n=1 Tax=Aurantibacter crassamenti TaxID=1837375 RepID=UPI00193A3321|nr:signal peptidase II [Aurantibacter crassamenti]MBM1107434.1 signal peptidase II [Aurantibacter crassamenti]
MRENTVLRNIIIIALVLLNIGCDQISKEVIRKKVEPSEYIQVVGDNFIVTNVENTGAMLGFGKNLPPIIKIIVLQALPVLVLLILLTRILRKKDLDKFMVLAFACVIGGGIGNLIDRIMYGSVTDFLFVEIGFFKTGIFNMADVSVTMGVILILLLTIYSKKQMI